MYKMTICISGVHCPSSEVIAKRLTFPLMQNIPGWKRYSFQISDCGFFRPLSQASDGTSTPQYLTNTIECKAVHIRFVLGTDWNRRFHS